VPLRRPHCYRLTPVHLARSWPRSNAVPLIHGLSALPGSKVHKSTFALTALDSSCIAAVFAVGRPLPCIQIYGEFQTPHNSPKFLLQLKSTLGLEPENCKGGIFFPIDSHSTLTHHSHRGYLQTPSQNLHVQACIRVCAHPNQYGALRRGSRPHSPLITEHIEDT